MNKELIIKSVKKYIALTVTGILLFIWAADHAYMQRGYKAYGGEYLLPLLPALWWLVENTLKQSRQKSDK